MNALHISVLLNNFPLQLAKVVDGSAKKYKFKDVLPGKKTYAHLSNTLSWLENAGLIYRVYSIENRPMVPLKALAKENRFKLFLFDVGLLGAMLELPYESLVDQDYGTVKGFFAENYVACELRASGMENLYSWTQSKSEVEFLFTAKNAEIYPLEVKSGKRTKAKSLQSFFDRYTPKKSIKLVGKAGGSDTTNLVLPVYYAGKLDAILGGKY